MSAICVYIERERGRGWAVYVSYAMSYVVLPGVFATLGWPYVIYKVGYCLLHFRAIYHTLYHVGYQLVSAVRT